MEIQISGVILAGGSARRFGGATKAKIIIEGESIIDRILDVSMDLFYEFIIVTNTPEEFVSYQDQKITTDFFEGFGPLAGIHAGLKSCTTDAVFVFAGDMPFLNKNIITAMIGEFANHRTKILIPQLGDNIEPLHAIYDRTLLNDLESFIRRDESHSVRDFIKESSYSLFKVEDSPLSRKAFTNINSPSDIRKLS